MDRFSDVPLKWAWAGQGALPLNPGLNLTRASVAGAIV
jgi:hypothetical protein